MKESSSSTLNLTKLSSSTKEDISESMTTGQNLKRWLRTGSVYIGLLLLASAYSNWQPMFLILDALGSYSSLCPDHPDNPENLEVVGHCKEQYDYLAQIYSVAGNMAYVIGLVAGIVMDAVGGTTTMASGVVVVFTGWILIMSSTKVAALVWPGMILLGCAENLLGFPGFLMADFWPKIRDTCASLCIAMQMLSSWVPALIWTTVKGSANQSADVKKAIWIYLAVSIVPAIAMIVSVPGRRSATTLARKNHSEGPSSSSDRTADWKTKEYWIVVFRMVSSIEFILFTVWYILITLGYQFYNTKIATHAEGEGLYILELIGWLNPFRAIIGPVLGIVSDWIGPFPMVILDNVMIIAAFAVALIRRDWAYNVSVVFYIIGRSYVFTTKFIFVQRFYPSEHFGKLTGILSLMGGLFGFLNAGLQIIPMDSEYLFAGSAVLMFVVCTIPIYLMNRAKKNGVNLAKSLEPELLSIATLEAY